MLKLENVILKRKLYYEKRKFVPLVVIENRGSFSDSVVVLTLPNEKKERNSLFFIRIGDQKVLKIIDSVDAHSMMHFPKLKMLITLKVLDNLENPMYSEFKCLLYNEKMVPNEGDSLKFICMLRFRGYNRKTRRFMFRKLSETKIVCVQDMTDCKLSIFKKYQMIRTRLYDRATEVLGKDEAIIIDIKDTFVLKKYHLQNNDRITSLYNHKRLVFLGGLIEISIFDWVSDTHLKLIDLSKALIEGVTIIRTMLNGNIMITHDKNTRCLVFWENYLSKEKRKIVRELFCEPPKFLIRIPIPEKNFSIFENLGDILYLSNRKMLVQAESIDWCDWRFSIDLDTRKTSFHEEFCGMVSIALYGPKKEFFVSAFRCGDSDEDILVSGRIVGRENSSNVVRYGDGEEDEKERIQFLRNDDFGNITLIISKKEILSSKILFF